MNAKVDAYLIDGCGRCNLYRTPQCKVNFYREAIRHLRVIVLQSGLKEELKWSQPCYTYNGKNVLLLATFKNYCFLSFFKGALLKDEQKILYSPGVNSQATRQLRFTTLSEVVDQNNFIMAYIKEAIELEKANAKVAFKAKEELLFPDELIQKMESDPAFKQAFLDLTPGRQRGYILHFTAAKQSSTRSARIEKSVHKIMQGKGWNEY